MADPPEPKPAAEERARQLDVVERWFQTVIAHPEGVDEGVGSSEAQQLIRLGRDQLEQVILRSQKLTAGERLSIYANAYYARLVECLGECFPIFRKALGEEVFSRFALEYLQRYPSQSYTLDHLGQNFTRFLRETRPDRSDDGSRPAKTNWPDFLFDLATLEWTVAQVFDGPGIEQERVLAPDDLQVLAGERFGQAQLVPVVCLRLLTFRYPVNAYYTAARGAGENEKVSIPDPSAEHVAITRRDYIVRRYTLTAPQRALLEVLQTGGTLTEAISGAAEISQTGDDELAVELQSWFRFWAAECFFQAVVLPGEDSTSSVDSSRTRV